MQIVSLCWGVKYPCVYVCVFVSGSSPAVSPIVSAPRMLNRQSSSDFTPLIWARSCNKNKLFWLLIIPAIVFLLSCKSEIALSRSYLITCLLLWEFTHLWSTASSAENTSYPPSSALRQRMVTLCDLHELSLPVSSELCLLKLYFLPLRLFKDTFYMPYRLQVLQDVSKQRQFHLMDGLFSRPDCGPVFTGLWCRSTTSCWTAFILPSTAGRLAPLSSARDEDVCLSHTSTTVWREY